MRHKIMAALSAAVVVAGGLIGSPAAAASTAVVNEAECSANSLAANDDSSTSPVLLPFKVNFYGKQYDRLYVNNNGNVTFDAPLSTFTPFGLESTRTPIIAPFFADVDTRNGGGYVGYGWGQTLYEGRLAFCVTWHSVGYYSNHTDKQNTFQLLLVQHGRFNDMDIVFNYDQVQWETGDASGGRGGLGGSSARAGFSNGSGEANTFFEMPGSAVNGAFLDGSPTGLATKSTNSTQPGRHIFSIRGGAAPMTRYVALGDSYSSGFGMGLYEDGTNPEQWGGVNDCQRSPLAYSGIVASTLGLNKDFHACQGAVSWEFYHPRNPADHKDDLGDFGEEPQLDYLRAGKDVRLVTLTLGGNDAQFSDIYFDCADGGEFVWFDDCSDDKAVTEGLKASFARLNGEAALNDARLQKIIPYGQIFRDIRARAPYAERVVIGYPRFFELEPGTWCWGISKQDQTWIYHRIDELNAIIAQQAVANGFRYVDPNSLFVGHEMCAEGGEDWFFDPLMPGKVHPTHLGHQAMAKAIIEELTNDTRPRFMVMPSLSQRTTVAVDKLLENLSVGIEWPGSDIELTLTSPSGKVYNRSVQPDGATNTHGPTWDQLTIPHPEVGTWQVEMYGADVDPQGEEARLSVAQVEAPNKAPTGAFDVSFDGTALKLDASKSTDADGTIASYDWFVRLADGTERVLHGATASTPLPAGQQFKVTLVVVDDDGADTFTSRMAVAATVDVKPDSADNPINIKSKGVTPMAVLSTSGFDATQVLPTSVRVGPAGIKADKAQVQDVNGDGRADLMLHVSTPDMGLRSGDTTLSLYGTLRNGVPFVGADHIRVLK